MVTTKRAIRKAIVAVKDRVAGIGANDLEVLVLKATSHDADLADEKYVRKILNMMSNSDEYVHAAASAVSKRLSRTRDWIVALKALILVHHLLNEGEALFARDLMALDKKGLRVLDMSDARSNSWDCSRFVSGYSVYLDQKLALVADNEVEGQRDLRRLGLLLQLLVRFVASKPVGDVENSRLVRLAMEMLVKDSFGLYSDVSDVLKNWFDRFSEMDYDHCVDAFDTYADAVKIIEDLGKMYGWCNEIGLLRPIDYPQVERISVEVLAELEALLMEKRRQSRGQTFEVRALPSSENRDETMVMQPEKEYINHQLTEELVDLKDEAVSAIEDSNKMALALFSAPTRNGKWVDFSTDSDPKTASPWQSPAAQTDKANWELALVESTTNLNEPRFGGGLDILVLDGIYDQGTVRQYLHNSQLTSGSASSVALPAPDGAFQAVAPADPFAASLSVPPPAYVQIAEMERKQHLMSHEQMLWQQYANNGMQGEMRFAKISGSESYYRASFPYGVPQYTGLEQPGSHFYPSL